MTGFSKNALSGTNVVAPAEEGHRCCSLCSRARTLAEAPEPQRPGWCCLQAVLPKTILNQRAHLSHVWLAWRVSLPLQAQHRPPTTCRNVSPQWLYQEDRTSLPSESCMPLGLPLTFRSPCRSPSVLGRSAAVVLCLRLLHLMEDERHLSTMLREGGTSPKGGLWTSVYLERRR